MSTYINYTPPSVHYWCSRIQKTCWIIRLKAQYQKQNNWSISGEQLRPEVARYYRAAVLWCFVFKQTHLHLIILSHCLTSTSFFSSSSVSCFFFSSHLLSSPLTSLSPLPLVSSQLLSSSFISFCLLSFPLVSSHSPSSHNTTFHLLLSCLLSSSFLLSKHFLPSPLLTSSSSLFLSSFSPFLSSSTFLLSHFLSLYLFSPFFPNPLTCPRLVSSSHLLFSPFLSIPLILFLSSPLLLSHFLSLLLTYSHRLLSHLILYLLSSCIDFHYFGSLSLSSLFSSLI